MQYGEFRHGYDGDTNDTRLVFYGLRYILETFVTRRWTLQVRGGEAVGGGGRTARHLCVYRAASDGREQCQQCVLLLTF